MSRVFASAGIAEVKACVRGTLAAQGFGSRTEIDVAATMKTKLDADMAPYRILGACDPATALRGLGRGAAGGRDAALQRDPAGGGGRGRRERHRPRRHR